MEWAIIEYLSKQFVNDFSEIRVLKCVIYCRHVPKRTKSLWPNKNLFATFIAASFTTAGKQEEPRCSPVEEWIRDMQYIHTREYYSAIKTNEILIQATI